MSIPFNNITTGGLGDSSIVAKGLSTLEPTPAQRDQVTFLPEEPSPTAVQTSTIAGSPLLQQLTTPSTVAGPSGPSMTSLNQVEDGAFHSFSGSDIRVVLDMPGNPVKQLVEVTTITVSIHREKAPARALGYTNPKGYARGRRTIAGTIVLTQFNVDFLFRFLGQQYTKDFSKSDKYHTIDQLPPFNLSIYFFDEWGIGAWRRLEGIELVTDGSVYSSADFYTERTLSYMASDFTPLLPLSMAAQTSSTDRAANNERTASDVVKAKASGVNA